MLKKGYENSALARSNLCWVEWQLFIRIVSHIHRQLVLAGSVGALWLSKWILFVYMLLHVVGWRNALSALVITSHISFHHTCTHKNQETACTKVGFHTRTNGLLNKHCEIETKLRQPARHIRYWSLCLYQSLHYSLLFYSILGYSKLLFVIDELTSRSHL